MSQYERLVGSVVRKNPADLSLEEAQRLVASDPGGATDLALGWIRANPGKRMPWLVVTILTVLAAGDAITPGFPFPGSALVMVPLAAAVWIKKLSEYGVAKEQIAQAKELQSG